MLSETTINFKKTFFTFFFVLVTLFYVFNVFLFCERFYLKTLELNTTQSNILMILAPFATLLCFSITYLK